MVFLNVYFVPSMELNLLSINQIMYHSPQLDVVFNSHKCSIVSKETRTTIVIALEDHGLYRLVNSSDFEEHAMATKSTSINNLWHQWYGHLNIHSLSVNLRGSGY